VKNKGKMDPQLRPYQKEAIVTALSAISIHNKAVLEMVQG